MSPERWQRIKAVLDEVGDAPAGRRREALARACGGEADLERDAAAFLELEVDVEEFIEEPLWALHRGLPAGDGDAGDPIAGHRIGPYRLERLLGRGGMGAVFLAAREDDYRQRVALKVVSWGTESEEVLARFYNERQILAQLEHPHIARLLDGGTTGDGRPYFVMEYVEGEPIDRWCETRGLSIAACLELFCEVCAAVHFAHQNLVIHRDLKASNILVTASGRPRLLDFGIAKALAPERAAESVATVAGRVPMTPAYASPEQLQGRPVTTASDVYALGALLYRLLSGHPPFPLAGRGTSEIVDAILSREPKKPSAAVVEGPAGLAVEPTTWADGGLAAGSGSASAAAGKPTSVREARRRQRRLAGDLDAIVLKAMRKEPRHRYGSAAELADDLRRHLDGRPVEARQGKAIYHLGRFFRRHKLALAAVLLVAGLAVTSTVLWRRAVGERIQAEQERARAEREQTRAERVSGFLEDLFRSGDPDRIRGGELSVREILERGRETISCDLAGEPEVQAELLGTLGTAYQNLGLLEEARTLKQEGLARRRAADPADRGDLAKDLNNLASLLYSLGDYEAAESSFREALAMRLRLGHGAAATDRTRHNLASTLMQLGRWDEAEPLFEELLASRRELYGPASPQVATSLYSLGALYSNRGEYEAAEPLLRWALAIRRKVYGEEHPRVAAVLGSLGWVLRARGEHAQARECYEKVLTIRLERLGADHPAVATARKNLAAVLLDQGGTEAAGALLEQALAVFRASPRHDDWDWADAEGLMGAYLTAAGRYEEAEPLVLASYRAIRELRGEGSDDATRARARVARLYEAWGRPEEAAAYRAAAVPAAGD